MKRFFISLFSLLTIYVIYIDLTAGTLPHELDKTVVATVDLEAKEKLEIPFFDARAKRGETVISIVENHINKPLPVSIDVLIKDFQQLNPGITAEKIKIGATYSFPDYSNR